MSKLLIISDNTVISFINYEKEIKVNIEVNLHIKQSAKREMIRNFILYASNCSVSTQTKFKCLLKRMCAVFIIIERRIKHDCIADNDFDVVQSMLLLCLNCR